MNGLVCLLSLPLYSTFACGLKRTSAASRAVDPVTARAGGGPYRGGRGHPGPPARAGPGRCGAWPARRPAALPPRRAAGGGGRSSCIYGWAAPRIAAYRDPGGLGCAQQTARASQTFIRWGQKSSAPSPSFGATV